jgi:hypothetical protein
MENFNFDYHQYDEVISHLIEFYNKKFNLDLNNGDTTVAFKKRFIKEKIFTLIERIDFTINNFGVYQKIKY